MLTKWNINIADYEFLAPNWLWLLIIVPIVGLAAFYIDHRLLNGWKYSGNTQRQFQYSDKRVIWVRRGILLGFLLSLTCLIVALAKPFSWNSTDDTDNDFKMGIDIILTIDISTSMLENDFPPNRLEAAKDVAVEFLEGRANDRIGLVAYAGEAFTVCPATTDYVVLKRQIESLSCEFGIEDGTAIGVGLGTAVTRLRNDSLPSKVIILLTDGSNNAGNISPLEAAELAKAKNICVYTIGVGGDEQTMPIDPFGMGVPVGSSMDETTLQQIAQVTDGKYFRARDKSSLTEIYKEIDKLEKRKMIDRFYESEPPAQPEAFLNWAILLALLALGVRLWLFKMNE